MLQSLDLTDIKVSNISWTVDGTVHTRGTYMELPCMWPESSHQPEQSNIKQCSHAAGCQRWARLLT